ncbi:MAG: LacI family DNA-binding transcriptional regulator [Spirochaetales bacterium]|nr:LacI family DNA-binding transcriptional regulator [Spirochaetales bacterium]HOV64194.1 LacI family DNA-binding transcriptional regulator [Spirochaetia bacterium]
MAARLKDIAKASGVSISTVSRILNGVTSRKPNDETCRRVLQAAREMGYLSDIPAKLKVLSGGLDTSVLSIGCILTSDHETFVSPFFSSLLAAIQNTLVKLGYSLKYKLSVMNIIDPGFSLFMESTQIDCGIMLGRTKLENINLIKQKMPNLVYAGVNSIGSDFDEVLCDGYRGALCAVQYLIGLGHRKIGYIGSTQQKYQVFNEHRYQGFLDALNQANIKVNEDFVIDTHLTTADGYASMREMIERKTLPTAIFCGNDTVALGVMKALSENGISVPDDISIIGFDNIEMAAYSRPALTTISIPTKELGRLAVKIMLDKLETGRDYPVKVYIPFSLIERESCKAVDQALAPNRFRSGKGIG